MVRGEFAGCENNRQRREAGPDHLCQVQAVKRAGHTNVGENQIGISAGEDGQIRQWQATDLGKAIGKQTKTLPGHAKAVFRLAHHPDVKNPLLASCSADMTVRLWNPVAGTALKTMPGFTDMVYAVAISPDGKLVAGGAANGEVRIFDTTTGNPVSNFNATPGYTAPKVETPKK